MSKSKVLPWREQYSKQVTKVWELENQTQGHDDFIGVNMLNGLTGDIGATKV